MAVTQIDVDEEALAAAMRLAGTSTKKDTVNLALREFVASQRRAEDLARYSALAKGWDYEAWKRMRDLEKDSAR